jgi:DNA-binding response OmpR family regulator
MTNWRTNRSRQAGLPFPAGEAAPAHEGTSRSEGARASGVFKNRSPWEGALQVKSAVLLRLVLLIAGLLCVPSGGAVDEYTSEYEAHPPEVGYIKRQWLKDQNRENQELLRPHVMIPDAVGLDVLAEPPAPPSQGETMAGQMQTMAGSADDSHQQDVILGVVFLVGGILIFRKLAPEIVEIFSGKLRPSTVPSLAANSRFKILAEEEAFAEFLTAFHSGPPVTARAAHSSGVQSPGEAGEADTDQPQGSLAEFLAEAPACLLALGIIFQEIGRTPDDASRQKILGRLCGQIQTLKNKTSFPELLPVFQMASALEGLLKQLTDKPKAVTRSTLRTVASGLDLLKDLCAPGLRPDMATNPPIRLLAVDDDSVSRFAISYALTRIFKPDLAEQAEAALALATEKAYDVIFLDVMMPGMDGFELCSKIHEFSANRGTPVVFVTSLSDFEARAKSTLSGGNDLIGKPFLTYEITVKALTLALRGRLQARSQPVEVPQKTLGSAAVVPVVAGGLPPTPARNPAPVANPPQQLGEVGKNGISSQTTPARGRKGERPASRFAEAKRQRRERLTSSAAPQRSTPTTTVTTNGNSPAVDRLPDTFVNPLLANPSAYLQALRDLLPAITQTADETRRQQMLVDLYLRIHSLTLNADSAGLQLAFKLSSALEGLLKKLIESTRFSTATTLPTITSALDLLHDLCPTGSKAEPVDESPIHILVVDDDPLTRRAITGALQTAFEKPDSAEGGVEALALATKKPYDAIFLDVMMPGMDGFEVCTKIRELSANRHTPVLFVTALCDPAARDKSTRCGGSDFIAKPFVFAELTVKALTFALRGRLQKRQAAPVDAGGKQVAAAA